MPKAIIIIPSQGADVAAFDAVARAVRTEVYGGQASIVSTAVTEDSGAYDVTFRTSGGGSFSWEAVHGVSTVMTISHGFSCDGPNLAYHDGGYQPWGSSEDSSCAELTQAAKDFWAKVGAALVPSGKIILVGCFMGGGSYASNVAAASGRKVFASTSLFGAGNKETTLKYVKAIEAGRSPSPMVSFAP